MKELIAFAAFVATVAANICTGSTGNWSSALAVGVTDFAHGGVPLSKGVNCFDGCLATGMADQSFKVALRNSYAAYKKRELGKKADRLLQLKKMRDDDDDPNASTCIDPQLRADIRDALGGLEEQSCKGIVDTLVSNLNRPGWAINCVNFEDFSYDGIYQDMNFCAYFVSTSSDIFDIRLGMIDYT
ncbi:hypothetical protein ANCCAN_08604 [Ancylostoma caninum]|uniref:Uncharacterized protein n=1 Tax=Ancylostoma caninum TaxID=29170 RepID=A0A368GLX3_ANCCA|nr:hypothetical protein ANCCAN_08604 [Ancylostoma caninum]